MKYKKSGVKDPFEFHVIKFSRLDEKKATFVPTGYRITGLVSVIKKTEKGELVEYGPIKDGTPAKGFPLLVNGNSIWSYLRTSVVENYWKLKEEDGQDKIVLPKEFAEFNLPNNLKDGDIVVRTRNSIYLMYKLDPETRLRELV